MPTPSFLITQGGEALHTEQVGPHIHLVVEDHARVATQFKTASTTSAATTPIVLPRPGGAIIVTDLVVSQDKVASGAITVRFTDGANNEVLFKASTADAPVALAVPYQGRMRGWLDAKVEMISAGTNPETDVTVVYYHVHGAGVLSFADWDALR